MARLRFRLRQSFFAKATQDKGYGEQVGAAASENVPLNFQNAESGREWE
jgi:hypothetical protein